MLYYVCFCSCILGVHDVTIRQSANYYYALCLRPWHGIINATAKLVLFYFLDALIETTFSMQCSRF